MKAKRSRMLQMQTYFFIYANQRATFFYPSYFDPFSENHAAHVQLLRPGKKKQTTKQGSGKKCEAGRCIWCAHPVTQLATTANIGFVTVS